MTEKYAQALVAGSVPVVIGAPNIEDYAIAPNSMLVLQTKEVGCVQVPRAVDTGNFARRQCQITQCRIAGSHVAHCQCNAAIPAMQGKTWRSGIRMAKSASAACPQEGTSCDDDLALSLAAHAMHRSICCDAGHHAGGQYHAEAAAE